uniref:Uncharacterized protein n=1 Tax=Romanomermis culicivorax TaxID=13658 RepID=A0A915IE19_ROMCU
MPEAFPHKSQGFINCSTCCIESVENQKTITVTTVPRVARVSDHGESKRRGHFTQKNILGVNERISANFSWKGFSTAENSMDAIALHQKIVPGIAKVKTSMCFNKKPFSNEGST